MKLVIFIAIIAVLGILTQRTYTTVKQDLGFGCSHYWAFVGEEDLQALHKGKETESPLDFEIDENVSGTLRNAHIRHTTGLAHLSSIVSVSNNSDHLVSTNLLMKLVHEDKEYQMEEVMLNDFSTVSTLDTPLRINIEAGSELVLTFFFNYEIFDSGLKNQSLHQIILGNTNSANLAKVSQQQLTRVKRTFNCIFGKGHTLQPG